MRLPHHRLRIRTTRRLLETSNKLNLEKSVEFIGRVKFVELKKYLQLSNIGVAFVPLNRYYQFQPLTKLFEYLLAGIPCLASNTYENRGIITSTNGLILENNSKEEFCKALLKLAESIDNLNSEIIRNSVKTYTWEHISHSILKPILIKIV